MDKTLTPEEILGKQCRDVITGVEGCCVGIVDWMFGCLTVLLQPKGKPKSAPDVFPAHIGKVELCEEQPELSITIPSYTAPKHFGYLCRDKVSGYEGICVGRMSTFYGSDQYTLQAKVRKGRPVPNLTIDEGRIEVLSAEAVIEPEEVRTERPGGMDIDFSQYV